MLLVRNDVVHEYKADRMPVSIYIVENKSFTNHQINLEPGDNIYLFSDGFTDQFGDKKGKKFKMSRFKELLLEISSESMPEQQIIIKQRFNDWIKGYDQIDDILMIGFRII